MNIEIIFQSITLTTDSCCDICSYSRLFMTCNGYKFIWRFSNNSKANAQWSLWQVKIFDHTYLCYPSRKGERATEKWATKKESNDKVWISIKHSRDQATESASLGMRSKLMTSMCKVRPLRCRVRAIYIGYWVYDYYCCNTSCLGYLSATALKRTRIVVVWSGLDRVRMYYLDLWNWKHVYLLDTSSSAIKYSYRHYTCNAE